MYILEIIAKLLKNKKIKNNPSLEQEDDSYFCDHMYMAIDSTKDYLACTKCGNVIKNSYKETPKNFFLK